MASSSNQKSSSSASRAQKPTFRRATKASKAAVPKATRLKPTSAVASDAKPAPSRKAGASYAVPSPRPAKKASRPVARGAKVGARASARPVAQPTAKAAGKSLAKPAAPAARQAARPAGKAMAKAVPAPRPAAKPVPKALARPGKKAAKRTFKSIAAPARPAAAPARPGKLASILAGASAPLAGLLNRLSLPKLPGKGVALGIAGGAVALVLAFIVVANTSVFAATDVRVEAGERVTAEEMEALLDLPENATLLNVDTTAIDESLQKSPWLLGADVERQFPHTLVIKPRERVMAAIAYIAADDVAWGIGGDGNWIAPLSLAVTVDGDGEIVEDVSKLATGVEVTQLTGLDAALAIAKRDGAVLLRDVSADVSPSSGSPVESDVIEAGLAYINGFSPEFLAQVKDISVPSVEAIAVNLVSGVEVSVGAPENIKTKEKVVTKLLEQEQGVTYINVRTPDSYTFRSADVDE